MKSDWASNFVAWFVIAYFKLTAVELKIYGRENIPLCGTFIATANHLSYIDPAVCWWALKRTLRFWMKKDIIGGFGWLNRGLINLAVNLFGVIPVERKNKSNAEDKAIIQTSEALLLRGECVGSFPSGTREDPRTVSSYESAKTGTALLARRSGKPILPMFIRGTEGLANPLNLLYIPLGLVTLLLPFIPYRRKRVVVIIGKPYCLEKSKEVGRLARRNGTARIMKEIYSLKTQLS